MADITAAARTVFRTLGYKRTQVADIAAEVGLSPAALYRHVESKEALFHLCFLPEPPAVDAYVATPAAGATVEVIKAALRSAVPSATLRAALRSDEPPPDPAAELAAIIGEQYRSVAGSWELLALIEASARDIPDLRDAYYHRGRRRMSSDLARYVERRVADGSFRPVPDPALVAVQIRELCAWFAWHRRNDLDNQVDDEAALASVVDTFVGRLVP